MAPLQASELKSCMVRLEWESVLLAAVFRIDEGVNRSALGGSGPNPGGKGQGGTAETGVCKGGCRDPGGRRCSLRNSVRARFCLRYMSSRKTRCCGEDISVFAETGGRDSRKLTCRVDADGGHGWPQHSCRGPGRQVLSPLTHGQETADGLDL